MAAPQGIDFASVDRNVIDFAKVKASGHSFAIARASFGGTADPLFPTYWPAMKAAGLVRGAYMFWYAAQDPERQVDAFIRAAGELGPGDLPGTFDLEFPGGRAATGLSIAECLRRILICVRALRSRYGVPPMIYTSARVWREDMGNIAAPPELLECPLWLARWTTTAPPPVPTPWATGAGGADNWWVHQYAGDAPPVPGVSRVNDLDSFHVMAQGEIGDRVKRAQVLLRVKDDGIFGPITRAAVVDYQGAEGLQRDGIIGPVTWSRLAWRDRWAG